MRRRVALCVFRLMAGSGPHNSAGSGAGLRSYSMGPSFLSGSCRNVG
jgi:hypothetical protein